MNVSIAGYRMTRHALTRAHERSIAADDIARAVLEPQVVAPALGRGRRFRHQSASIEVVLDPDSRRIITVSLLEEARHG